MRAMKEESVEELKTMSSLSEAERWIIREGVSDWE